MPHTILRKTYPPPVLVFFFALIMIASLLTYQIFISPFITAPWPKWVMIPSFCASASFAWLSWLVNPGHLASPAQRVRNRAPTNNATFMHLLEQVDAADLCPECRVIKIPRSRHCNVCGVCIERFDHHCPWINTCVGRRNHFYFFFFISATWLFLLSCLCEIAVFYSEIVDG
jgi:palmitoyltransferase